MLRIPAAPRPIPSSGIGKAATAARSATGLKKFRLVGERNDLCVAPSWFEKRNALCGVPFLLIKFLFQGNLGSENGKKQQSQLNSTDDRAYCSDFRCCFPDFKEHSDNRSWQQKQAAQKPCFPEYAVRITPCQTVSHRPARTVSEYFIRFFRWSFQKPISETYHCNRKNQINQHHINPKSHLKAPSFPILSISIIAYYHYLVKPLSHQSCAIAALCNKFAPPKTTKTSPTTPPLYKAKQISAL